jgi:N-acetylmuramoyl-L-alanine amidase
MGTRLSRRRLVALLAFVAALGIAAVAFATGDGGHAPRRRVRVAATTAPSTRASVIASTTTAPATATTRATTTVVVTTTTGVVTPSSAGTTETVSPATVPAPVPVRARPLSLSGRTIVIDPGHNGGNYSHSAEISRPIFIGTQTRACDTTGTATDDGYTEAAYNLDVAVRLQQVLQAVGAHVVMTRTTNDGWGPCIDERAAIGNRAAADAAISIHADGGPAGGRGFHVLMPGLVGGYTDDIYSASHRLGVDVRDAFLATGMPTSTYYATQGLAERTDLGGLNLSNVPKVFIETGNMRNATDAALLENADFRRREAEALAVGLDRFLAGR